VRAAAHPLLIHHDGHAQVFDGVRFRLSKLRQSIPLEHAEVFI
jgi:hypothetical protein